MNKIFLIAAFAAITLPAAAQRYNPDEPIQTKSLANSDVKDVYAETSGGNLLIEGVSNGEARVEVYVWPGNNRNREMTKEQVEKRLADEFTITISADDHQLKVIAKKKPVTSRQKNSLGISFRMYVPTGVSSDLHTSGGNIVVKELSGGKQRFITSGGNIAVNHVSGDIKGSTSGGNIHVANSKNSIDLTTSGGNIAAESCEGKIKLSTSGGNVALENLNGDIDAGTSGGSIGAKDIEGSLRAVSSGGNLGLIRLNCSVEASTSGGNMDVAVQKLVDFVRLNNSGGNTVLKLPANASVDLQLHARRVHAESLKGFDGSIDEKHVEGKLNGGGVPVKVDGGNGNLAVEFR
jgi:DUF4097 and DUF4098 domain-containing protein YvlB